MILYKHRNNKSVAVEVLSYMQVKGKDYARIKIRWWKLLPGGLAFDMRISQRLTDAETIGNMRQRQKYPVSKWKSDWNLIDVKEVS